MPLFANTAGDSPISFYLVAIFAGLLACIVRRKPQNLSEVVDMLSGAGGGFLLLLLLSGAINTWGSPKWRAWASDPHSQAGAMGVSIALGGNLWGIVLETAADAKGMNFFEFIQWVKSGGKAPRKRGKGNV